MVDINGLSKSALAAAMRGGTAGWGSVASAAENVRYMEHAPKQWRRKCSCGCCGRSTHVGMANGVGLTSGCELSIRRWVKTASRHPARTQEGASHE